MMFQPSANPLADIDKIVSNIQLTVSLIFNPEILFYESKMDFKITAFILLSSLIKYTPMSGMSRIRNIYHFPRQNILFFNLRANLAGR